MFKGKRILVNVSSRGGVECTYHAPKGLRISYVRVPSMYHINQKFVQVPVEPFLIFYLTSGCKVGCVKIASFNPLFSYFSTDLEAI